MSILVRLIEVDEREGVHERGGVVPKQSVQARTILSSSSWVGEGTKGFLLLVQLLRRIVAG